MSSTHYCSCNPPSKQNREPAKWYCYRHRRHLCDNCIYDDLNQRHISCLVGTYDAFLKSGPTTYSRYKNKCSICNELLPDDAMLVIRLICGCVYHSKCLQKYLLSKTSNNIPCINCNKNIAKLSSNILIQKTNLGISVNRFLRSISSQRLWNKPKLKSKLKSNKTNQNQNQNKTDNKNQTNEHILLDTQQFTTRHRTVKTSFNKDGNKEDDKYNKKQKTIQNKLNKKMKCNIMRMSTRKIAVILLLLFALCGQVYFLYVLFGPTNNNNNNNNNNNKHIIHEPFKDMFDLDLSKKNEKNKINGLVKNLPNNLKQQLFGNKLKMDNMRAKKIN